MKSPDAIRTEMGVQQAGLLLLQKMFGEEFSLQ